MDALEPLDIAPETLVDLDALKVFRFDARIRLLAPTGPFRAPVPVYALDQLVGFAAVSDNVGPANDIPFVTLVVHVGLRYDEPIRLDLETEPGRYNLVPREVRDADGLKEMGFEIVRVVGDIPLGGAIYVTP